MVSPGGPGLDKLSDTGQALSTPEPLHRVVSSNAGGVSVYRHHIKWTATSLFLASVQLRR